MMLIELKEGRSPRIIPSTNQTARAGEPLEVPDELGAAMTASPDSFFKRADDVSVPTPSTLPTPAEPEAEE